MYIAKSSSTSTSTEEQGHGMAWYGTVPGLVPEAHDKISFRRAGVIPQLLFPYPQHQVSKARVSWALSTHAQNLDSMVPNENKNKNKTKTKKGKFNIDVCLSSFDTSYLHDPHFELRISPTNVALNSLVWQFGKFRYP
jgi:hypothetical protein